MFGGARHREGWEEGIVQPITILVALEPETASSQPVLRGLTADGRNRHTWRPDALPARRLDLDWP